ncbi:MULTISPECIES: hypothetical protein [unclassified Mycoplasma]|uniref:hypothetical protein n=1 Tax=Mycoplasma sp. 125 TaxID=3447505 RepID=UPI003F6587A3
MKKSNKILLTLTSISLPFIAAATVISCSTNNDKKPNDSKIDDQKKLDDPKKKEEGKEQEKKPESEIKNQHKNGEGKNKSETGKINDADVPSSFELLGYDREDVKLEDFNRQIFGTPDVPKDHQTPPAYELLNFGSSDISYDDFDRQINGSMVVNPKAQKIQNEIKVNEEKIDKKTVELETISKSELNDLEAVIEDADEQIDNLTQSKADDADNAKEYEALIKEYEDLKTKSKQKKKNYSIIRKITLSFLIK